MSRFIVLSGRKQAGKTTAADYIQKHLLDSPCCTKITSFASPIKDFCTDVLGLTTEQVYGTDDEKNSKTKIRWNTMPIEIRKRYGTDVDDDIPLPDDYLRQWGCKSPAMGFMTAREVMQIFGTDIMRTCFDFDIWAKAPFVKYADNMEDWIIIDDCRFPNEADMALEHGAILIRLTRNVHGDDAHSSEKAMDDYPKDKYTYVIDNSDYDTIEDLHMALDYILTNEGI